MYPDIERLVADVLGGSHAVMAYQELVALCEDKAFMDTHTSERYRRHRWFNRAPAEIASLLYRSVLSASWMRIGSYMRSTVRIEPSEVTKPSGSIPRCGRSWLLSSCRNRFWRPTAEGSGCSGATPRQCQVPGGYQLVEETHCPGVPSETINPSVKRGLRHIFSATRGSGAVGGRRPARVSTVIRISPSCLQGFSPLTANEPPG